MFYHVFSRFSDFQNKQAALSSSFAQPWPQFYPTALDALLSEASQTRLHTAGTPNCDYQDSQAGHQKATLRRHTKFLSLAGLKHVNVAGLPLGVSWVKAPFRHQVVMVTNSLERGEILGSWEVAKLMQEVWKLYLHVIAATGSSGKPSNDQPGIFFLPSYNLQMIALQMIQTIDSCALVQSYQFIGVTNDHRLHWHGRNERPCKGGKSKERGHFGKHEALLLELQLNTSSLSWVETYHEKACIQKAL